MVTKVHFYPFTPRLTCTLSKEVASNDFDSSGGSASEEDFWNNIFSSFLQKKKKKKKGKRKKLIEGQCRCYKLGKIDMVMHMFKYIMYLAFLIAERKTYIIVLFIQFSLWLVFV